MNQDQFLIYSSQKKPIQLKAERITLYRQAEIIEAVSENNEIYYLFFYKYHFLTAAKAKKLRRYSFMESAFKHGMVFNAPHPFIDVLLSSNQPCRISNFKPLMKELDRRYSLPEKAFILTFFESFISKKLFDEIKSIFYIYRRSGKNFNGYQIIRILMDFAPNHSFVRQMSSDKSFSQYRDQYDRFDEAILSADPVYFEKIAYANSDDDIYFQKLIARFDQSSRWIDLLALYSIHFSKNPSTHVYESLTRIAVSHFNAHQIMQLQENCTTIRHTLHRWKGNF